MHQSKVCVQEFWYFVSGLDIQLEKSEYNSPVSKKICCIGEIQRAIYSFFRQSTRTVPALHLGPGPGTWAEIIVIVEPLS